MNQEKTTTFPSDLEPTRLEEPPSKALLDSIAMHQAAERREKELAKVKAELLERIGRRAGEWLDRVLPKKPTLGDGDCAELSFTLDFVGYGPPPDEEELYQLCVKESYEEAGV
jgi:hypothetical protein